VPDVTSILLLQGDAEAQLLADADAIMPALMPEREIQLVRAWATRPDWLDAAAPPPPSLVRRGLIAATDPRALLEQPHRLVVFALLPAYSVPALRHRDGGAFLAHHGLLSQWSAQDSAEVTAECVEQPPITPEDAALALEPVIERLLARGGAVAVCSAFRHVAEPLEHRCREGASSLRERIRRGNLAVARLSQRTGCFVLDLDRPLAQEGGAALQADCFGGGERAAEIALDEFAALVLDALAGDTDQEDA
jgi:hypothetical protein